MKVLDNSAKTASPDETRARILAAARELFALKGTRGTTTREVADLAGVNEATVFRHFGTKHALLHAMLNQYCESRDQMRSAVAALAAPSTSSFANWHTWRSRGSSVKKISFESDLRSK